MQHTIPQPPVKPFLGNLPLLDTARPVQSLMDLSRQYGSFFKMRIVSREMLVASSQVLVDELCDETRFKKRVHPVLQEVRAFGGDGLFTAQSDESNRGKAHRVLMPAFGPIGVRGMFDPMLDIADQMFTRWERFGPDAVIDVPDAMTRLTLDTIALCGFDTRFNSFYRDEMHPFVDAMVGGLAEAGNRARRPAVLSSLMLPTARRFDADAAQMRAVARQLIAERRADPSRPTTRAGLCPLSRHWRPQRWTALPMRCSAAATGSGRAPGRLSPDALIPRCTTPGRAVSLSVARGTRVVISLAPLTAGLLTFGLHWLLPSAGRAC